MALQLFAIAARVESLGQALIERHERQIELVNVARQVLAERAEVTDSIRDLIAQAAQRDLRWRGAEPLESRLDLRCVARPDPLLATLIAVDGSQLYPDRHGIAPYFLVNIGSIILRQGTSEAPSAAINTVAFELCEQFDDDAPPEAEATDRNRDERELETLAELAESERRMFGADTARPIIALRDGPLLPWTPPRMAAGVTARQVDHFIEVMARLREARVLPVGYVDRPNSGNLLRTVELAAAGEASLDVLQAGPFRGIVDRLLLDNLLPGERSGLFSLTSPMNVACAKRGHKIVFFYLNVSTVADPNHAEIARVELPEWALTQVDIVQQVLVEDSKLTRFPYVLARAHELAVVRGEDRAGLEDMLAKVMLRRGLMPSISAKARLKKLT